MKNNSFFTTHIANGSDVLYDANFIIDMHHTCQNGVWAYRIFEPIEVDQAIFLHIQVSDFKTLSLKVAHGVKNSFVLGLDSN